MKRALAVVEDALVVRNNGSPARGNGKLPSTSSDRRLFPMRGRRIAMEERLVSIKKRLILNKKRLASIEEHPASNKGQPAFIQDPLISFK